MTFSDGAKERIKEQITQILQETGFTPAEDEAEEFAETIHEDETLRKLFEKAQRGELSAVPYHEDTWSESRFRDLQGNFLYGEYILHRLTWVDPLRFDEFTRWVGAKALFRLLTRVQRGDDLIRTLNPHMKLKDLRTFIVLGKHEERDPRLLLQMLFAEVEGSWEAVNSLLYKYARKVERTWEKHRLKSERTPLPGEQDWHFEQDNPLESAVEAYLMGATINEAASLHKISNRRLSRELTRLGIERVQRKGSK